MARWLRAPLDRLALTLEVLTGHLKAGAPDPCTLKPQVAAISRDTIAMQVLVENALYTGSAARGRLRPRRVHVDLREVLDDVRDAMAPLMARGGHRLRVTAARDLPTVLADARQLAHAVVNLVANAAAHGPTGAPIDVRAAVRQRAAVPVARVTVADRGPGVAAADRERLFAAFTVGAATRPDPANPAASGAGLGLAVVRAILQAHGGTVGVRRRPGGGAVFWLELPIEQPGPATATPDETSQPPPVSSL